MEIARKDLPKETLEDQKRICEVGQNQYQMFCFSSASYIELSVTIRSLIYRANNYWNSAESYYILQSSSPLGSGDLWLCFGG